MKRMVTITHDILCAHTELQGVYADFTCGNGQDTCFLAALPQVKHVYAFDIQKEAIEQTCRAVAEKGLSDKVTMILDGHEHLNNYIIEPLQMGIFNFGYLPNSQSKITTTLTTSKEAVEKALKQLVKHGLLLLVMYPAHEQGKVESQCLSTYCAQLDAHYYQCMQITMSNIKQSPFLLVIEKIRNIL